MNQNWPGRRRALTGALAFACMGIAPGGAGAVVPGSTAREEGEHEYLDFAAMEADADREATAAHAPFRAEFLAWFEEASTRFARPVSVREEEPWFTTLHVPGLHPAVGIGLGRDTYVSVWAEAGPRSRNTLACMDVCALQAADGSGWLNGRAAPEAQCLHPTREACWRQEGFEALLHWFNAELAPATHLAIHGSTDFSAAGLMRDGVHVTTGLLGDDGKPPRRLLPLYDGS